MTTRTSLETIFIVLEEFRTLAENPLFDHQSGTEVSIKRKTLKGSTKGIIKVRFPTWHGFAVINLEMDRALVAMIDSEIEGRIKNFDEPEYDFASDPEYHDDTDDSEGI